VKPGGDGQLFMPVSEIIVWGKKTMKKFQQPETGRNYWNFDRREVIWDVAKSLIGDFGPVPLHMMEIELKFGLSRCT
jgi:hypothetical protein